MNDPTGTSDPHSAYFDAVHQADEDLAEALSHVGGVRQGHRGAVLQQHVADDAAAQPADHPHRPEAEQVHPLAARERAAQQAVGEDAEQVKDGGQ